MKKNYFNQDDINQFIAYINEPEPAKKEAIYNKYLYPFISKQIDSVLKSYNHYRNDFIMNNYNDLKSEINVYIYQRIIQNLCIEKIKGIQNLIIISAKNKLVSLYRESIKKKNIVYDYNDYNIDNEEQIIDIELNHIAVIEIINSRIDELINQQVNVNCVASIFLQLLKNYIIQNDYNPAGFKEYCCKKMCIGSSQFLNLAHQHNMRTIAFKSKKI